MIDRLRHLEDKDAMHKLQISAEVPVSISIKDVYGNEELVKGKADWALGYGNEKSDTGAILLIDEAKPCDSAAIGMPQLLVYMAAVQESRIRENGINKSVFGMLSDSKEFRFSFLDENKKLFMTQTYTWVLQKATIISCIDEILASAIESSSHTTPTENNNQTLRQYSKYLGRLWKFGDDSDDECAEDVEEQNMVDVISIGGRLVLRASKP